MIKKDNRQSGVLALLLTGIFLINGFPLKAQDVITSEDFTGGSSAFVWRTSRKPPQNKAAFRANSVVKRTTANRIETTKRITRQNITVAKVNPKRAKSKEVDPKTLRLNSAEFKRKSKEETSVIFAGVGEYYLNRNEIDQSIEFFREATVLDEKNEKAKFGLSEALTRKGDELLVQQKYDLAKMFYDDALNSNPNNAFAYAGLGEFYESKEDIDNAILNYEKAITLDSDLTEINAPLGALYFQKGEIAKSESYLQKALASNSDNPETYFYLGLVRYRQNRNAEAAEALRRSIQIAPTNPEAHYYLGEVYDRLNLEKEAIDSYREAVRLNPKYVEAWFDLGVAYYNRATGQGSNSVYFEEAIKAYREVARLKPDFGGVYENLGDAYRQIGKIDEAIGAYRSALEASPNNAELHSKLGYVAGIRALTRGYESFWKLSIDNLEKAAQLNPEYINFTNLGWAYYNAGQTDLKANRKTDYQAKLQKAKEALQKAISLNARIAAPFLNLGIVLNELGEFRTAIDVLKRANELQKNWVPAINELGLAYRLNNDLSNAVKQFRQVISIDDKYAAAHYNLAETEFRRGNLKEAKKSYEQLKRLNRSDLVRKLEIETNGAILR